MTTELNRARAYLLSNQHWLEVVRRGPPKTDLLWSAENGVLASLSWVWDAQERAKRSFFPKGPFLIIDPELVDESKMPPYATVEIV